MSTTTTAKKKESFHSKLQFLLNQKKSLNRTWIMWLSITLLTILFGAVMMAYARIAKNTISYHPHIAWPGMFNAIFIMGFFAVIIPVIPYFYLMVTFFVGINAVYRSNVFHIFLLAALTIAFAFVVSMFLMDVTVYHGFWGNAKIWL